MGGTLTLDATSVYFGTGTFNNNNTPFYVNNAGAFSLGSGLKWGNLTNATSIVSGKSYRIVSVGNSVFTNFGALNNDVGTVFTANGPGSGSGTAALLQLTIAGDVIIGSTLGSTIASGAASGSTSLQPGQAASDINSNTTTISGGRIRTGSIESTGYTYVSGNFSTAGMQINLGNGAIRSKNFGIDSSGNAFFNGTITAGAGEIGGWSIEVPTIDVKLLILGQQYTIVSVGTTTDWNTVAGTSGVTYAIGNNFRARAVGTGNGTVKLKDGESTLTNGSGPSLSILSPQGWAWFSSGVVTTSVGGYGGPTTTGGATSMYTTLRLDDDGTGEVTRGFLRNISYGDTKPSLPRIGDIHFT